MFSFSKLSFLNICFSIISQKSSSFQKWAFVGLYWGAWGSDICFSLLVFKGRSCFRGSNEEAIVVRLTSMFQIQTFKKLHLISLLIIKHSVWMWVKFPWMRSFAHFFRNKDFTVKWMLKESLCLMLLGTKLV